MNLDEALDATRPPEAPAPTPEVPKGWERSLSWNGTEGELVTGALTDEPTEPVWRELIADWQLDPDLVEIVGPIRLKGWDSPVRGTTTGETIRLRSYSARIQHRQHGAGRADLAALCKAASRRKPPKRQATVADEAERAMIVALSDWQVGKGEGGGSAATVERIGEASAGVVDRLRDLKRIGRPVDVVYLVGLGDLVEQCNGHYPSQAFTTDLTRREQAQVILRLVVRLVDLLVDAGPRVVLSGVAGNHGENRNGDGKAFTTPEDNDDLALLDQCAVVFSANPERYEAVSVWVPENGLSMTLECAGVRVGFAHGHISGKGSTHEAKVENWWTGQIVGDGPTAPAEILVTGHLHHLVVSEMIGRTHIQAPAMDGGSRWYTEQTGQSSPPGLLTFCVGDRYGPRRWGDLAIV